MDDLELESRRIFERDLAPGPQDEALDRAAVEWALSRVRQRRTFGAWFGGLFRSTTGWAALGAVAGLTLALVVVRGRLPPPQPTAPVAQARAMILDDGSEIDSDSTQPAVQIAEQSPTRTTVRLHEGGARFRIRHDSRRLFRVDAGPVQIEDLGTIFHVAHQPEGRVRVTVTEGRVAVVWPATGWRVELGAGADRTFGPIVPAPEPREPTADQAPLGPPAPPAPKAARPRRAPLPDGPAHLLLSADEARRAGQPSAAVAPLKRLVDLYPADPRAPSAAFTLGWILLTDLGRPREAALAFIEAERIAPRGTLAEDAAARVAEAWQKAGDARRARAAARRYQQVYPTGRYVRLAAGIAGQN